jgi:hypothetical protein
VSRLEQRIGRLERTLGRCHDCRATIELINAERPPAAPPPPEYCATCNQPRERITVLVAFDPDEGEP